MAEAVYARFRALADTRQARREIAALNASWGSTMATVTRVGKIMMWAAGYIAATAGAFVIATMAIKDYELALTRAGAIGGLTATQTALVGNKLMESAMKYGAASEEMAQGVLELTKAGFDFETVMKAIDTITKVNIANNLSYAESAEIATLVMKAFDITVDDLEGHMDKLQLVVNKTLMDMGDFIPLLRYAGSTGIAAKVATEELYAMAGALSDVAQEAGTGARGVNRMMIEILKSTDEIQAWANAMGLSVTVIKDGRLNITEIIESFSSLGMSQDMLLASIEQFSIRSARAWLGLMINADEYFQLLQQQGEAAGYLQDTVAPVLDTLSIKFRQLMESIKAAFRTPEFVRATHKAFDELHRSVMLLIPDLQVMMLGLLKDAPQMFRDTFAIVRDLIPILSHLFDVFKGIFNVLAGIPKWLLKFILYMMIMNKMAPVWSASMTLLAAHMKGVGVSATVWGQALAGVIMSFALIMGMSDGLTTAIWAIAVAIGALGGVAVALRAGMGDVSAIARYALGGAAAGAAVGMTFGVIKSLRSDQGLGDYSNIVADTEATLGSVGEGIAGSAQAGLRRVPRPGIYELHEDERVLNKEQSLFGRGGGLTFVNYGTVIGDEDGLRRFIRRIMKEETEEVSY
jgi:TP901 family phage tail tape measure protein